MNVATCRFAVLAAAVLLCAIPLLIGCKKASDQLDQQWTGPVSVSSSKDGLGGWANLYRCQDTIIALNSVGDGLAKVFFLNGDGESWSELPLMSVPTGYLWGAAAIDHENGRILLPETYAENEQLVMKALTGNITRTGGLQIVTENQSSTDKTALLGEAGPNVRLNDFGRREGVDLGAGIVSGSEMYIPYCLHAVTSFGVNSYSNGPFNNGVFYSSDSGKTWQRKTISDFDFAAPQMCRTQGYDYYFAIRDPITRYGVSISRKSRSGEAWDSPNIIAERFANVYGRFDVAGEGDTVHICWMDRRHNKSRFNPTGPPIENNDIYYCRRKDLDSAWSKEELLSKGLLYAYAPTISVEGDNAVVVWAGIRTAGKWHTYMAPNDIYYVTSKDRGKTWTRPSKVTDGAKDGMCAGMPQVALLSGVIHLLYTQGRQPSATELSPGLTKLDEGPWPIYYQQRPFPN